MRMLTFAKRNIREILRDPLNLAFGLGFPLVLLLLLSAIQANVPVPLFEIAHLAPGISVFGLSFLTLFSATVISKDRGSALLQRLYTTPMTAADFILGYTLPMLPLALLQAAGSYLAALCLGLQPGMGLFYAVGLILPVSVLYIAMGLLCGSVFNEKQVGGVFQKIANLLPFVHAVELERAALNADWAGVSRHIWWVLGYGFLLLILAVSLFLRQMKRQ